MSALIESPKEWETRKRQINHLCDDWDELMFGAEYADAVRKLERQEELNHEFQERMTKNEKSQN